jgi:HlyD family secretion protein
MKKQWLWGLGVAVPLAGIVAVASLRASRGNPVIYQTVEVGRGPLTAKITATGTLSALVTVQVGSQVSGRIQDIYVDYNSPVKKGQLIARIDPQLYAAAVQQARANKLAADANLERAKVQALDAERTYDRQAALAQKKLIAQADLDTAEAQDKAAEASVSAADAALEQARAALDQAEVNLAYTSIVSPINGVVISRNVDVGQTVAASLQAPTLFTIAEDLKHMQVDTNVAEADVGKLKPGMEATFTVDAYPQSPFHGRIRQIRNAPITVQNVVTYDAVIDVENPDLQLRPGMTANVTVVYAQAKDVLRVPNAALRYSPPVASATRGAGGEGRPEGRRQSTPATERRVWVLAGGVPKPVTFTPGITDGTHTEVASGDLHQGERIIVDSSGDASRGLSGGGFHRFL